LRYFHINEISPSGWIKIQLDKTLRNLERKTTCKYEYEISNKYVIALNEKEDRVPYKICSFDIEASSSHGDFPIPIKSYKKLATNIIEIYDHMDNDISKGDITKMIKTAFGFDDMTNIDKVYPKNKPSIQTLNKLLVRLFNEPVKNICKNDIYENSIEKMFEKINIDEDEEDDYNYNNKKSKINMETNIIDLINDNSVKREDKIDMITNIFKGVGFPQLEGDKVTFIGSTFMKYGDEKPYLNNCIVLNTCSKLKEIENSEIETYNTEKQVLLAWKELIMREDPDIIIGYNIFGFDYQFIHIRARENDCEEEFLKLSRNIDEICGNVDQETNKISIEESKIII
jgi:hypothetical protein